MQKFISKCYLSLLVVFSLNPITTYADVAQDEAFLTHLAHKYGSDKGSSSGKGTQSNLPHYYTRHYAKLFHEMRYKPIHLLEIGLNLPGLSSYASLNMWLKYFPYAKIDGIDINYAPFFQQRATIFWGDQGSDSFWCWFVGQLKTPYDIVIDDGSHSALHQQKSLGYLFPHLQAGGIYIIEDLHYYTPETELAIPTVSFLNMLKEKNVLELTKTLKIPKEQLDYLIDQVENVEFFDSLTYGQDAFGVIRKKKSYD